MPQVRTYGIMWKNARIYKMCHRSGPVELCEKMLEFIKCATGPDLWNYMKKMLEYIKCATGPDLWNYVNILRKNFYFEISKVRQVRTCEIMWKNAGIYKICHRSGPVELFEKLLEFIKCATGPDLWNYVKNW